MEQQQTMYDAFISYRHLPEDMAVAERIHKLLERRKYKNGRKLRVFRDRSELPTSSDLGADIRNALAQSKFLIVICTPDYQKSKWCMEELAYFRKLHGERNSRILPVLVSGEPKEAFPNELMWEYRDVIGDQGTAQQVVIEVEPLGADVRGDSFVKRMWLLQTEYLRIAAPILGVKFDDLYQRAQRRKWAAGALVLAALLAFLGYSLFMLEQINEKQRAFYESQSLRLANEGLQLTTEEPELAMLLADEALPEDLERPAYSIVPEAELLMRSAVLQRMVENQTNAFVLQAKLEIPFTQWVVYDVYPEDGRIIISDYNRNCVFDLSTGHLIGTVDYMPAFASEESHAFFVDGGNYYVVQSKTEEGISFTMYHTASGENMDSYAVPDEQITENAEFYSYFDPEEKRCYIIAEHSENEQRTRESLGCFALSGEFEPGMQPQASVLDWTDNYVGEVFLWLDAFFYPRPEESELSGKTLEVVQYIDYLFEGYWEDYGIEFSPDQSLCLVTHVDDYGALDYSTQTTLFSVEDRKLLAIWDGRCVVEPESGLVFLMQENNLYVYNWKPENVEAETAEDTFRYLSSDGSFVLEIPDIGLDYSNSGKIRLFKTAAMDDPVFEKDVELFRVSEDEQYIIYTEGDPEQYDVSTISVYSITDNKVIYQSDPMKEVRCVCIDGQKRQFGWIEYVSSEECRIYIADMESGALRHEFVLETDGYPLNNMELSGAYAVVQTNGTAYLYDLEGESIPVEIDCYLAGANFYGAWPGSAAFTADGLLILGYDGVMSMGAPNFVAAIYDLKNGKTLSYLPYYSDYEQNYLYDEASGSLIIQVDNRFYVQRRNDSGDFETVYTIDPQGEKMTMNMFCGACDGTYFVLNGEKQCEIYSIADGTLLYILKNEDVNVSRYGIVEGMLYDLRIGQSGMIRSFPLMTTQQAREASWEMLTQDGVKRELTAEERLEYYIPEGT